MLQLQDVHAYYGDSHILKGVSMEIRKGELATLLSEAKRVFGQQPL
jgi:branched-chain amino acid transport system ATP-binding protein